MVVTCSGTRVVLLKNVFNKRRPRFTHREERLSRSRLTRVNASQCIAMH